MIGLNIDFRLFLISTNHTHAIGFVVFRMHKVGLFDVTSPEIEDGCLFQIKSEGIFGIDEEDQGNGNGKDEDKDKDIRKDKGKTKD